MDWLFNVSKEPSNIPPLSILAAKVVSKHLDRVEHLGAVPDVSLVDIIIAPANAAQLRCLEIHNAELFEQLNMEEKLQKLWKHLCFKSFHLREHDLASFKTTSFREMYEAKSSELDHTFKIAAERAKQRTEELKQQQTRSIKSVSAKHVQASEMFKKAKWGSGGSSFSPPKPLGGLIAPKSGLLVNAQNEVKKTLGYQTTNFLQAIKVETRKTELQESKAKSIQKSPEPLIFPRKSSLLTAEADGRSMVKAASSFTPPSSRGSSRPPSASFSSGSPAHGYSSYSGLARPSSAPTPPRSPIKEVPLALAHAMIKKKKEEEEEAEQRRQLLKQQQRVKEVLAKQVKRKESPQAEIIGKKSTSKEQKKPEKQKEEIFMIPKKSSTSSQSPASSQEEAAAVSEDDLPLIPTKRSRSGSSSQ